MSAAYSVEQAERDLAFLQAAGAVRKYRPVADAGTPSFVVVMVDHREHEVAAADVRVLRVGVLAGWRLPRVSSEVLGG